MVSVVRCLSSSFPQKAVGSASIGEDGWCGHLLAVDVAEVSRVQCFVLGVLLALHGDGGLPGLEGGFCPS